MSRADERPTGRSAVLRRWLPLALLASLGVVVLVKSGGPQQIVSDLLANGDRLHEWIARLGPVAPLAFVLGYVLLMMLLWIPAWLCTLVGGFLFGFWLGALYSLAGATLGATSVFLLARIGPGAMTRHAAPFVRRLEHGFRTNAFSYLIVLRLVPVVPFAIVNIVPSIVGVPPRTFALATLLGIVPSTLIYAGLGNSLSELGMSDTPLTGTTILSRPSLILPLVGLALLALAPVWYRRLRQSHARP